MKKSEKIAYNELVSKMWNEAIEEYRLECDHSHAPRLRSCTAWVYETTNYYWLRSYNTIIACIDKRSDTLIDALRLVYGYTSTSAGHIAKFNKDYSQGTWGCRNMYRYLA